MGSYSTDTGSPNFQSQPGLSKPSQSNSAFREELNRNLANDMLRQAMQMGELDKGIKELQGTQDLTGTDFLGGPGNLTTLLGGGLAALLGAPELGLGMAVGGLSRTEQLAVAANTKKDERIAQLEEERERLQELNEAQRNRVTNLVTTQPEMFTDPETGEPIIDPALLGYMATGAPMPLHPESRIARQRRDEQWSREEEMLTASLAKATSPQMKQVIVNRLFDLYEFDASPKLREALAAADEWTPEMNWDLMTEAMEVGGESALQAWQAYYQDGASDFRPYMKDIAFYKESGNPGFQEQLMNEVRPYMATITKWVRDHPNEAAAAGDDARIVELALPKNKGAQLLVKKVFSSALRPEGDVYRWALAAEAAAKKQNELGNLIQHPEALLGDQAAIDAITERASNNIANSMQTALQNKRRGELVATAAHADQKITVIMEDFPGATPEQAGELSARLLRQVYAEVPREEDGSYDSVKLIAAFDRAYEAFKEKNLNQGK
jgi:hypothetical protein